MVDTEMPYASNLLIIPVSYSLFAPHSNTFYIRTVDAENAGEACGFKRGRMQTRNYYNDNWGKDKPDSHGFYLQGKRALIWFEFVRNVDSPMNREVAYTEYRGFYQGREFMARVINEGYYDSL